MTNSKESRTNRMIGVGLHLFASCVMGAMFVHFYCTNFKTTGGTRFSIRDETEGRRSTCEIHQVEMQRTLVPVLGFWAYHPPSDPPLEITFTKFPHAKESSLGGCSSMARRAYAYVCVSCKEARQRWIRDHL